MRRLLAKYDSDEFITFYNKYVQKKLLPALEFQPMAVPLPEGCCLSTLPGLFRYPRRLRLMGQIAFPLPCRRGFSLRTAGSGSRHE